MRLACLILCLGSLIARATPQPLTEINLISALRKGSPEIERIRAIDSLASFESATIDSKFETRAQLGYDYGSSNEDGLASFIPVYSPTKEASLSLIKPTPYGIQVGVKGFASSINTKSGVINDAARAGTKISLEMDLLRNLFGRSDLSEVHSARAKSQLMKIQAQLNENEFELEVRKLFWSLVANGYSLALSEELIKTAHAQLKDSVRRQKAGSADSGDVARNTALVQSRESSAYLFKYEREKLLSQMKKWVPALVDQDVQPQAKDLDATIREVLKCVDLITTAPWLRESDSDYFQLIAFAEKQAKAEERRAKTVGDWDLKLSSYYQQSGVGQGFGRAIDEYNEDKKDGYGVGLALTIPLEGTASKSEKARRQLVKDQYFSEVDKLRLKLHETHKEVVKALALLRFAAKAQNDNVEALEKSVASTQRKYRQARISLSQLVLDQDSLFNSQLQSIQTKLSVIHALYDYFKVANNSTCHLNKIAGSHN